MIADKLLINLKILSKIQKNGRIARSYDGIIALETDAYYQSAKRFLLSDSRKQAVFEINSIISEAITTISSILNSKYMSKPFIGGEEYMKACENLQLIVYEMEQACQGIQNLKFTYQNDQNISSQLDITILKITTTIRDVTIKLASLETAIPPHMKYNTVKNIKPTELESIRVDNSGGSSDNNTTYFRNEIIMHDINDSENMV